MDNKRPLMYTIKQLDKEWIKYLKRTSGELGISDTFRQIIMYLSKNPGANQKNIAGFFNMTGAAVSQTIKEMQFAGFICKETDETDQRFSRLYLTQKAEERVEYIRSKIFEADNFITRVVSPKKEAEIVEILSALTEAIRKEI